MPPTNLPITSSEINLFLGIFHLMVLAGERVTRGSLEIFRAQTPRITNQLYKSKLAKLVTESIQEGYIAQGPLVGRAFTLVISDLGRLLLNNSTIPLLPFHHIARNLEVALVVEARRKTTSS